MQLNKQQRHAVTTTDKPLLVLAGAGSGKTGVITQKIAWLIRQKNVAPNSIYAVTFTNKAASEMRQRLGKQLDKGVAGKLNISTFHRLGLTFLQREAAALGLRRGFTILDQTDSLSALRGIISEGQVAAEEKIVLTKISAWKNAFVTPETALAKAENNFEQVAALVYAEYVKLVYACNSVDFDDLICLPVTLLQGNEEVRERWQARVLHLLVDEYQDTNTAQYALVRLLTGPDSVLTAVGDDDQSIYSWRGANPENLNQLQIDYPGLEVIKLEQNYRSCQRILRSANAVIAGNPHVYEKKLWSELPIGDMLRVSSCADAYDEAEWVAAEILSLKLRHKVDFGDVAILYRSNFQSRLFEQTLREKQIGYQISGGKSFFDRSEIKDVMAYLKLMVNPDDDTAFLRIINTPRRDIGPGTLAQLGNFTRTRGCSLFNACHEEELAGALPPRATKNLQQFANWMTLASDNAERGDAIAVLKQVLEDIRFEDWLSNQAASREAGVRAIDNVHELLDWIKRQFTPNEPQTGIATAVETNQEDSEGSAAKAKTLADIVHQVTLMDILARNDNNESPDQVNMMTLHAAKGLEFGHVYLVGAEEEILPHRNSMESDTIEEERRLAYVGITRARYNLTLSWARKRQRFGETFSPTPSRFIDELPEDDVHHLGAEPTAASVAQNEKAGRDTLESLKALLGNS